MATRVYTTKLKACKAIFTDRRSVYPETEFLHGSEYRSRLRKETHVLVTIRKVYNIAAHTNERFIWYFRRLPLNLHFKLKTFYVKGG